MADAGIKKVIIKKASLPALDHDKVGYILDIELFLKIKTERLNGLR